MILSAFKIISEVALITIKHYDFAMNENEEKKKQNVLTITSLTLTVINFLSFIVSIYFFSIGAFKDIVLLVFSSILVISFVMAIVANRVERIRVAGRTLITVNSIILGIGAWIILFGSLSIGFDNQREEYNQQTLQEASRNATIEHVKGALPDRNLYLGYYANDDVDEAYHYYDDDGEIVEKFRQIRFVPTTFEVLPELGNYHSIDSGSEIAFFLDCSGVSIHGSAYHHSLIKGYYHHDVYNYYSCDKEDIEELIVMVDAKKASQQSYYNTTEAEIKNNTTLESTIDTLNEEGNLSQFSLFKEQQVSPYQYSTYYFDDTDKEMYNALKSIDFASVKVVDNFYHYREYGFANEPVKESRYSLLFDYYHQAFIIKIKYPDVIGVNRYIEISYKLKQEDVDNLINKAIEIAKQYNNKETLFDY